MQFCSKCKANVSDGDIYCGNCGAALKASGQANSEMQSNHSSTTNHNINNHLAKAIIVTILCCLPFGIVAIVNAASVNDKIRAGDIEGAMASSKKANTWANWSIVAGAVFGVIYFFIMLFAELA